MPSRIPQKLKDLRDVSTIQADSLLQVADVVATVPRCVWFVYGGSTDGGTTPNTTTQVSIDALLAAGILEANIRWLYEEEGNVFVIADITSTPTIGGITLELAGGSFVIGDITTTPTIDNIVLINADTLEFVIADVTATPTIENIVLELAGGLFAMADITTTPMIEEITLVMAGGTFTIADITTIPTIDNITITNDTVSASSPFTQSDGALDATNWSYRTSRFLVASNKATTNNSSNPIHSVAVWKESVTNFPDDHSAEAEIAFSSDTLSPFAGAVARGSINETTGYFSGWVASIQYEAGIKYVLLQSYVNQPEVGPTPTSDTYVQATVNFVKVEANGTTIKAYGKVNSGDSWGTALLTFTSNTDVTTGQPGMLIQKNNCTVDNWYAVEV